MKRIGLTASKMAKGNIWLYHVAVVFISFLFAMFIFLVCGFVIAVAMFAVAFLLQRLLPSFDQQAWMQAVRIVLRLLGILIAVGTLVAIIQNVKIKDK
jgi:hypothetical protein